MFNICYECDEELTERKGHVYGYWGDAKIKFIGLPKYQCNNCNEFYLDEEIAILTQEITRALSNTNEVPEIIDISDCHMMLIKNLDKVYNLIKEKRITFAKVGQKLIMNSKDINSLFSEEELLLAARNKDVFTPDVQKEINELLGNT